ncbi:hypothetical protein M0R72_05815 [Candidatus Pacearchaeota archaeon]|nr:hypothetical protein [Candidatus Pacearchaeota archaeon]
MGLRTAQLIDEVNHALVDHPRTQWSPELEALYVKALEQMHIVDEIDARGEPCSKDECVYEAPLKLVREGLCSS